MFDRGDFCRLQHASHENLLASGVQCMKLMRRFVVMEDEFVPERFCAQLPGRIDSV